MRPTYSLDAETAETMLAGVRQAFPREACGLLGVRPGDPERRLSVTLTSCADNTPASFRIRDEEIAAVGEALRASGQVVAGCFHSHTLGGARPSGRDRTAPKAEGELWLIYAWRLGRVGLFRWSRGAFNRAEVLVRPAAPGRKPCACHGPARDRSRPSYAGCSSLPCFCTTSSASRPVSSAMWLNSLS